MRAASCAALRRRLVAGGMLTFVASAAVAANAVQARGDTPLAFSATASADSVHVVSSIANFPASRTPVDSGGPAAQVAFSSSGGGIAYSAAPDPGSFAASLPGLGAGVLAGVLPIQVPAPVPGYPLSAHADNQTPSQSIGAGAYELKAEVKPASAVATTSTGGTSSAGNAARIVAEASIVASNSGVEAEATSETQGFTVGPLSLGRVRSHASVTSDASGVLTKSSQLVVDGAEVGNQAVGLTPQGFTIAGVPVPANHQATLNSILKAANVSVTFFPKTETPNGVVAAGIVVTQKETLPELGDTVLTYRIGGVSVNLQPATSEFSSGTGSAPFQPANADPGALPSAAGTGAASDPLSPLAPAATGAGGSDDPPGPLLGPAAPATTSLTPAAAAFSQAPLEINTNGLYLSVVTAGLLGLGVMQLLRTLGVRLTWTS